MPRLPIVLLLAAIATGVGYVALLGMYLESGVDIADALLWWLLPAAFTAEFIVALILLRRPSALVSTAAATAGFFMWLGWGITAMGLLWTWAWPN